MEEKIFKADAKQIVDMCFNNKLFKETVSRDDMSGFEDLIAFLLQSRYESYLRVNSLLERMEKSKTQK